MTKLTNDSITNINLLKDLCSKLIPTNEIINHLTVCQGILEAGLENSPPSKLALLYNNLFGVKGMGTAGVIQLETKEWSKDGGWTVVSQPFAIYKGIEDSILHHTQLLQSPRYINLWRYDLKFTEAAQLIHDDGYATDPNYPSLLVDIWKKYIKCS